MIGTRNYKLANDLINKDNSKTKIKYEKKDYVNTKEPHVFGPPIWFTIHISAAHYPLDPSIICKEHAIMFIRSIPYILPCHQCFLHAQEYISRFSKDELLKIVSTRKSYFEWGVYFHNFVNKRLNKKILSVKDAYNIYMNGEDLSVMKYGS